MRVGYLNVVVPILCAGWFVAVVPSGTLRADIEVSGVYCLHGFGVVYSKVVVTAFVTDMASSAAIVTSRQRSRLVAIVLIAPANMMRCPTALESRAVQ